MPDSSQAQTEQASVTSQSDRAHSAFGLPAVSLGPMQPPVSLEFLNFLANLSVSLFVPSGFVREINLMEYLFLGFSYLLNFLHVCR